LLTAQGHTEPGPIPQFGNQIGTTNRRFRFPIGALNHCATGLDHVAPKLEKQAHPLHIEMVRIS
jgi:hypothetical protein